MALTFIQWSQECEKAKPSAAIISQSFQLIWKECDILLRLVGLMTVILICSRSSNIQGREPYPMSSKTKQNKQTNKQQQQQKKTTTTTNKTKQNKTFSVSLFSSIYRLIYLKRSILLIETTASTLSKPRYSHKRFAISSRPIALSWPHRLAAH